MSGSNAPFERYYLFDWVQVGDVSNDGTSDVDYVTSIKRHTAPPAGSGTFRNGATSGSAYADFDSAYDPINGLNTDAITAIRYAPHVPPAARW